MGGQTNNRVSTDNSSCSHLCRPNANFEFEAMKNEEDRDRNLEFETDDEENQAQSHYSSSSSSSSARSLSYYNNEAGASYNVVGGGGGGGGGGGEPSSYQPSWPQSYRQSIDMMSSVVVASPSVNNLLSTSKSSLFEGAASFLRRIPSNASVSSSVADHRPRPLHPHLGKPLLIPHLAQQQQYSTGPYKRDSVVSWAQSPSTFFPPSSVLSFAKSLPPPLNQCSTTQAIINGMNVLCGVGLLTTPYALKQGGWASLSLLILFGIVSCYTGILLKKCLDSSPGLQTYPDIGQAAFGTAGRIFISSYCVEYITLVGDSLASIYPSAHLSLSGLDLNSHQLFALTTAIAVLPTVWLRDLSLLSYLSAGGVVATTVVVICLFWAGVIDGIGFHRTGSAIDFVNLPVALGMYGFCYSGHSVFPNIYTSMKKQSEFPKVLMVCFFICVALYAGVAAAGYSMFGESIKSQFTLNMPGYFFISKVAIWTTVINPLTKYALTMTPVALSIEELLPTDRQSHSTVVLIRTALVLSTLLVALSFPYFGLIMALLGSIFAMLVALILPCACYLKIQYESVNFLQVVVCSLIMLFGTACACVGSFSSIKNIINKMG